MALMLALPLMAAAQTFNNTFMFLHGEGTEEKPYLIDSYEALVEFRELAALQKLDRNRYVCFTADIDLGEDPNWAPIRYYDPQDEWYFKGNVDGKGHTISNMNINKRIDAFRTDEVYLGLFGRNNGDYSVLKNLNLKNVKINVSLENGLEDNLDIHVGALAGYSCSMVKNVHVDGEINISDESDDTSRSRRTVNVGGVVGKYHDDGNMATNLEHESIPYDLNADINITSNALGSNIGGIAGYAEKVVFQKCTSSGMLTGNVVEVDYSTLASQWNIAIGGICGYSNNNLYSSTYDGLCSVCRVFGGNWTGGLFGYLYASFSPMNNSVTLQNCYAAGGVSDAYNYSGGIIGAISKHTNSNVTTYFKLKDCYYAGTLTILENGKAKSTIGNYTGNKSLSTYEFVNCFYDNRMTIDDTDYQTLLNVSTPESMPAYIYGYDTSEAIGTTTHFMVLADEEEWIFEEGRYPQLKAIANTPASILAVTPVFFENKENAERVFLGVKLSEASVNGVPAQWSAPVGNGSVAGMKLMSDAVGYEILTLTAGTCAKRLNLYMANSDVKWEGEDHIPTGTKAEVFPMYNGNGTSRTPYYIMNAGQLAYALKNNEPNEYYIIGHDININSNLLTDIESAIPWIDTKKQTYSWKANLDGGGFLVHGLYLPQQSERDNGYHHGLLGTIAEGAVVANLGLVEAVITDDFTQITKPAYVGGIAGSLANGATIENCFTSGYVLLKAQQGMLYAGGICGKTSGNITDCLNAMAVMNTGRDVMTTQLGGIAGKADANATFTNCLNIGRTSYLGESTQRFGGGICPTTGISVTDCHYDHQATACAEGGLGLATAEMTNGSFFSGKNKWKVEKGHYPQLEKFVGKEHMTIISQPLVFNNEDHAAAVKNILELPLGKMRWNMDEGADHLMLFADYGLAEPKSAGMAKLTTMMKNADGSKMAYNTLFLTVAQDFNVGIQFIDPQAERACVEVFGANGYLTLEQAISVTDFSPFINHSATPNIVQFPEMRYFTGINRLTNQLSTCTNLQEVDLPLGLKTITEGAFSGCNKLTSVTMPVNLAKVEPYAFRGSALKEILVHPDNSSFVSRSGVLFDANEYIVAYPPKRDGIAYMYTNPLKGIYTGAFQNIEKLETLYIGDDEGTYIDLKDDAIPTDMMVYVNDATDNMDYIDLYRYDEARDWQNLDMEEHLQRYYPLRVTSAKYATMCINFDTQLPKGVTSYLCTGVEGDEAGVVKFREIGRLVPTGLPVLIYANKAGTYPLYEYEDRIRDLDLDDQYDNYLGSGEHGFIVGNQSASSGTQQGSILTLGHNSQGTLGFFFYRNDSNKIPAYRAYLVVDPLTAVNGLTLRFEDPNGIVSVNDDVKTESHSIYDLSGRKVAEGDAIHSLPKGIYIQNGRKILVK